MDARTALTTVVKADHWTAGFSAAPVNVIVWEDGNIRVIMDVTNVYVHANRGTMTLAHKRGSGKAPTTLSGKFRVTGIMDNRGVLIPDTFPTTHPVYLAARDVLRYV